VEVKLHSVSVMDSYASMLLVASLAALAGCSSSGTTEAADCSTETVSRFKELEIVDDAVVGDHRASNAADGAWSFRHHMESMTPDGQSTSDLVYGWLGLWRSPQKVNLVSTPARALVESKVICPWMKRTPANQCDDDCNTCSGHELDLAAAPFRLIAIANRIDLRNTNENGIGTESQNPTGEGRFVYALTNGPADDPASAPMNMTVIIEYRLPHGEGRDAAYWARRWHALGSAGTPSSVDESYRVALQDVTDEFAAKNADPSQPNGSSLGQIRTNEKEFDWQWDFREFHLTTSGFVPFTTRNTPDLALNASGALHDFVVQNRAQVLAGTHTLPSRLAGAEAQAGVTWTIPGVDEPLRKGFAKQTCNGCHGSEAPVVDANFHVSPFKLGEAKLSAFLNDPNDQAHDDLSNRADSLRQALCGH